MRFPTCTVKVESSGGGYHFGFLCILRITESIVNSKALRPTALASRGPCPAGEKEDVLDKFGTSLQICQVL